LYQHMPPCKLGPFMLAAFFCSPYFLEGLADTL
jgi:hypothetical protein